MDRTKPDEAQIRAALHQHAPQLADEPVSPLGDGWEFWAFSVGDYVLRFPMREGSSVWKFAGRDSAESLRIERALTPALAGDLPVPSSCIEIYAEMGPNDAPFAGHRFLPGRLVMSPGAPRPSPHFGRDFGRLVKALHDFPAERAIDLGVPLFDAPHLRAESIQHYESVIRRVFPLVSCEARTHIERVYEDYLNHSESFDFEPVLVHTDLAVNTLVDASGDLSGVIDFGDAAVSSPALDLWLPVFGFRALGIEDQTPACLAAAGIDESELQRMQRELAFLDLRYPLIGILHGLATESADFVEESLLELNAMVPFGIECAPAFDLT